jgi:peptide/nickel transport system permease protein
MLFGGQISLLVGLVAVGISTSIGIILGALAGYYRGWVDTFIMRLVDIMLSIPSFFSNPSSHCISHAFYY